MAAPAASAAASHSAKNSDPSGTISPSRRRSPEHKVLLAARRDAVAALQQQPEQVDAPARARVLDDDQARPQRHRRVAKEGYQDSVLGAFRVDLECVDP